jgi:hypothetical protein
MDLFFEVLVTNASLHLLPEAAARHERRLEAVRCKALLGREARPAVAPSPACGRPPQGYAQPQEAPGDSDPMSFAHLLLLRCVATIHRHGMPNDKGGCIRAEPNHRLRHFLRPPDPTHGMLGR